jgi:predicted phage baseplate assembly protein
MSLAAPILDDRSFEQLREELVRRIPTYTPEWTNHNESDPGIALLELFAYLGESLLFRFNQLPETTKLAFLNLLRLRARPARPAHAIVVGETDRADGAYIERGAEMQAGSIPFETEDELNVWPLDLLAIGKVEATGTAGERADIARRHGVADDQLVLYDPTPLPDDPNAPDAPLLDVRRTVDQALWIALLARDVLDRGVVDRLRGATISIGIATDASVTDDPRFDLATLDADEAASFRCPGVDLSGPAVLWRLWQREPDPSATLEPFATLSVAGDTTRGLTETGVVTLRLPRDLLVVDLDPPPSGGVDSPPPIDDEEQAARVVAWLQVTRPQGENDAIHRLRWAGINAVRVVQARTAPLELIGVGNGDADQRFSLTNAGVLARTVVLEVEEPDGWRRWDEVDSFVASRPDDRHFVVDAARGEIHTGRYCRRPQLGERVRVRSYRHGGGLAGRVGPDAITRVTKVAGVQVTNPLPAWGGGDAERLDDALDRIPEALHRHDRAVTPDDYRALAREVAGVGRAETLLLFHPDVPHVPAAGVVSVIVFPDEDVRNPAAPMPDRPLLRDVCAYLDRRRLLTAELYVLPPTYRAIAVAVGVKVRDGYPVDGVRRWVERILRQYLAPVPPLGPEGAGWPLGRSVRRQELEAVTVQVEGVEYLEGLALAERTASGSWSDASLVELGRWEVPELVEITVVEGSPLEPGEAPAPSPEIPEGTVLAPLAEDVC